MRKPKCIAIIPARGGSKRLPKKNIKEFAGKPMLGWTIEAAQKSGCFDRVFVSTDSAEIAEVAGQFGVYPPFLRDQYADDLSTVSDVTVYTLGQIQEKLGERYDIVVQLMPNCPLKSAQTIKNSLDHFLNNDLNFQISCFKFGWNNPWWATKLGPGNRPEKLFPKESQMRSQDLEELYCPTGAVWIAKVEELKRSKSFYGPDHRMFPISWIEALDIDTQEDWEMAELAASTLKGRDLNV